LSNTKREQALTPADFRALWDAKPVLRAVYRDYYERIGGWVRGHPTVELGAGGANLKETLPQLIASDIVPSPWLDLTLDAQAMPFASGSVANLVGVDVLHHIEHPRAFLAEAERTLKPGGRVVFVEPAITPVSWAVFKLGHPEPVILRADPLAPGMASSGRDPMDSNQAIPTLLAGRDRPRLEREFSRLRVAHRERLSLFAYPLSGGFRPWCLLPERLVEPVLRAERRLDPVLGSLMAFRLLLILERT
jgi:SAM-dependent methyltransferase